MRKFSSYGPINPKLHYYVPRQELIDYAYLQLMGENPDEGGHYITVWAPRQRGKTWTLNQVWARFQDNPDYAGFDMVKLELEHLKQTKDVNRIIRLISQELIRELDLSIGPITHLDHFEQLFTRDVLSKPLILILDEFDALIQEAINGIAGVFRNIYNQRRKEGHKTTDEKYYLLHGVALIGVRSVLGIENESGSPFNVQRSVHIPNLTFDEAKSMFHQYQHESGQTIEPEVVDQIFYETQGQPGLTSWLGELLTETYNEDPEQPIGMDYFKLVYSRAINVLPNANIVNIISKAKQDRYKKRVLEIFQTGQKVPFRYDDPKLNFLYMNGVIDWEEEDAKQYVKFPCPFVQKRLFNYFANDLFHYVGRLHRPFEDLDQTVTEERLYIRDLMARYEIYLRENRDWLFQDVPRRSDLRPYEAIYHFNLYQYLVNFIEDYGWRVHPEFPTGNGKIDLLIRQGDVRYGLELKSYATRPAYQSALVQAAAYGQSLGLSEIWVIFFVESIDDDSRTKFEAAYSDKKSGVQAQPVFVATGS